MGEDNRCLKGQADVAFVLFEVAQGVAAALLEPDPVVEGARAITAKRLEDLTALYGQGLEVLEDADPAHETNLAGGWDGLHPTGSRVFEVVAENGR